MNTALLIILIVLSVLVILILTFKRIALRKFINQTFKEQEYIVIVGLSKIGLRIAEDCKGQAKDVVVLSEEEENTFSDQLKSKGIRVINVKNINESALKNARIMQASSCLIVTTNENTILTFRI